MRILPALATGLMVAIAMPAFAKTNVGAEADQLQTMLDELRALIDKGERERLADPWYLRDLKDLVGRYDWPWRNRVLSDDFSGRGPQPELPWRVTGGRVPDRLALRPALGGRTAGRAGAPAEAAAKPGTEPGRAGGPASGRAVAVGPGRQATTTATTAAAGGPERAGARRHRGRVADHQRLRHRGRDHEPRARGHDGWPARARSLPGRRCGRRLSPCLQPGRRGRDAGARVGRSIGARRQLDA